MCFRLKLGMQGVSPQAFFSFNQFSHLNISDDFASTMWINRLVKQRLFFEVSKIVCKSCVQHRKDVKYVLLTSVKGLFVDKHVT